MTLSLTENAKVVLQRRYLLRDEHGSLQESPQEMFHRVARFIAEGDQEYGQSPEQIEALAHRFYTLMSSLVFLPNSPTLMNAGKPHGQLSACFVLPVEDSLEAIFETLKHAALIHQSGGGTGFSFSRLRPRGDVLKYTSGRTSGAVSFMEVYNAATEAIKQGGTRRGANMGILHIDHPDIEEFIALKNDLSRLTNFNISVAVTNAFMDAVAEDGPFDLIHPNTRQIAKTLPARTLMDQIVKSAWQTGEPGLIFIDRINEGNVTPGVGDMEATNPCGEVPLLPYEACNLGSINLGQLLTASETGQLVIDWPRFEEAIHASIHFLDNVITQNLYPIPQIKTMVEGNRKIGLGLMGWADTLMALGIPYDSEEALTLAERVMSFMEYHSKRASINLAKERGRFPFYDKSVYAEGPWFAPKYKAAPVDPVSQAQWIQLDKDLATYGLRNATTLCLAPTGTISIIAGASGGIEPLYALTFLRNILDNTELVETHPLFESVLKSHGLYSESLMKEIACCGGVRDMAEIPESIQQVFVTAHEVTPEWHIRMQQAFQKYSDNAVSKTINFPETARPEDIEHAYKMAYSLGLKGITVYRNNSRLLQPMSIGETSGKSTAATDAQHCPECKRMLEKIEGCLQCPTCHYAYCG